MKRKGVKRLPNTALLTEEQLGHLVWGWSLDPSPGDVGYQEEGWSWTPFASPEAMEKAWKGHRAEVLAAAAEEPFAKRRRTWAEETYG